MPAKSRIQTSELSPPVCVALQIGLVNLLRSWNVKPNAIVGHSTGEFAAAYAAGALTMEAAITVAYYCGYVTQHKSRPGAMAAIGMSRDEVQAYLEAGVVVGCENSSTNVTLSGDGNKIDAIITHIKADKPNIVARRLRVERAFHSQHMQEIGEQYQALMEGLVQDKAPSVPFFSSVTGKQVQGRGQLGPAYWRENLERPVLFSQAAKLMLEASSSESLLLEIGPHSAMEKPLEEIVKSAGREASTVYVPTLVRSSNGVQSLLTSLGRLFQEQVDVDVVAATTGRQVIGELTS